MRNDPGRLQHRVQLLRERAFVKDRDLSSGEIVEQIMQVQLHLTGPGKVRR